MRSSPGLQLVATLRGHTEEIRRIAWSPDGRLLASPSSDRTVRVWDATGGPPRYVLGGHDGTVYCVAWAPDSQTLASGAADGNIRLWDTQSGRLMGVLDAHRDWVNGLSWSKGGVLASGAEDGTLALWNAREAAARRLLRWAHSNAVNAVAWSPAGPVLASASGDRTLRLSTPLHEEVQPLICRHPDWVISLAWSPDGSSIATACWDGHIRLWSAYDGSQLRVLRGHHSRLTSLAFSHDGNWLASKACDDSVRLWTTRDWAEAALVPEMASGRQSPGIAFHPTELVLATLGSRDRNIRIWRLEPSSILGAYRSLSKNARSSEVKSLPALLQAALTAHARTKGMALENFVVRAIERDSCLRVISRHQRMRAEEIDVLVQNEHCEGLTRDWGNVLVFECKNLRVKVRAREIDVLCGKLGAIGPAARTGVIVAPMGITGTSTRDAILKQREHRQQGRNILVLDQTDLEAIAEGEPISAALQRSYEQLLQL